MIYGIVFVVLRGEEKRTRNRKQMWLFGYGNGNGLLRTYKEKAKG